MASNNAGACYDARKRVVAEIPAHCRALFGGRIQSHSKHVPTRACADRLHDPAHGARSVAKMLKRGPGRWRGRVQSCEVFGRDKSRDVDGFIHSQPFRRMPALAEPTPAAEPRKG